MDKVIFYKPSSCTHYKSLLNDKIYDPYNLYQSVNTQGFCQMFAYFITINNADDFKEVGPQTIKSQVDIDKFNVLAYNTQACAQKTLDLIESDPEILELFIYYFKEEQKDIKKGINKHASFNDYLNDFRSINKDIDMIKDYVIDNPLVTGSKKNRDLIYFSYNNDNSINYNEPITKLCVQPTEGETQYESFQSIMASIMSATHGAKCSNYIPTPYDLLCKKNNIILMDWNKSTKPNKRDINKWLEINIGNTSSSNT